MPVNRCAIYTRKSSEEGLGQDFNSLDAQREACAAFVTSQRHEGWELLPEVYEDGGFSGGNLNRPGLQQLLASCAEGKVDTIVVYKIDRLTRSLADFAKMVELFDTQKVSFVSVTQQFNTTTSMGRLTLNVLLSFAQFEREVTGERVRDKIAASKAKGMWMGGHVPLGYAKQGRSLEMIEEEAVLVRHIFERYVLLDNVQQLRDELYTAGHLSKPRKGKAGCRFNIGQLTYILTNPIYIGQIRHKGQLHIGTQPAIISPELWQAVQDLRVKAKANHRHRVRAKERSLLAGMLFDAEGRPMSPTHTNKQGKRYRYYLSQAEIQGLPSKASTITKIPASELESEVMNILPDLLKDDRRLVGLAPQLLPAQRELAGSVAQTWPELALINRSRHVRELFSRVQLHADHITCIMSLSKLSELLGRAGDDYEPATFDLPIKLSRIRNGQTFIIASQAVTKPVNQTLVKAIAKAYRWNHLLTSNQAKSLEDVARMENVRASYVRTLIPLAWLTPDIVEAVLEGQEPAVLTLAEISAVKVPDWRVQRHAIGF